MRDLVLSSLLAGLLLLSLTRPYIGMLTWSWFSFMNPHQLSWGFSATIPWAAMAFVATLVGCVVAREPQRPPLNAVTLLLSLFLVCITVTSYAALGPPLLVWGIWERTAKIILGVLLTAALLTDRWRIHGMVWIMVLSIGFFGVRGGIFTLVTGGGYIVMGPPNTTIDDRNHLAVALLVTLPLMNYLRLQSPHKLVRTGLVAAMVLTLFAAVGSQSRGAIIALAGAAAIMWYRSNSKVAFGVVIALAAGLVLTFMPESWYDRIRSTGDYQADASSMGRVNIWLAAINIALARPLTGGGFRATYMQDIVDQYFPGIVTARATHSIWLEVLGEHGFPTFFVWLGVLLAGAYYTMRIPALTRDRPELRWAYDLARMAQVSLVAYVLGGTFLSLGYWDFSWTLLVVMAATHALVTRTVGQSVPETRARRPTPLPTGAAYP